MRINIKKAEYDALVWVINNFDLYTNGDEKFVQEADIVEDMLINIVKKYRNAKRK